MVKEPRKRQKVANYLVIVYITRSQMSDISYIYVFCLS